LLQAREHWPEEREGAEVLAFPRASADAPRAFGRRAPRSFVVDLHSEEIGPRWFRGAGTLAALCGAAMVLAPGFEPFLPAKAAATAQTIRNAQLTELADPQPLIQKEPGIPKPIGVQAGERHGVRRVSGDIAGGLYFSLRGAGASPQIATDFIKAIATSIDVGEVAPFDRFDFAVRDGKLIYAGVDRAQYEDVRLLRWNGGWFGGAAGQQSSNGLMAPVAGRITSGFGGRTHPILGFTRFHAGIDFGARWGSPIVAAADGQVIGAGWSGGYGRQVRVIHGGGIMTSYSHMSAIVAEPGTEVRQGQVIGYVGSSGLSTGPHLHFEVRVNGRAINPLTAQLVSRPVVDNAQLAAFKARLKALMAIPMNAQAPARQAPSQTPA
jgi:hypothetical protein